MSIRDVITQPSTYFCSINTIALSRLLLNLRDVAHGTQRTMTPTSTLRFSHAIGPLGNVVHDGLSFREDEGNEMAKMSSNDQEGVSVDVIQGEEGS